MLEGSVKQEAPMYHHNEDEINEFWGGNLSVVGRDASIMPA